MQGKKTGIHRRKYDAVFKEEVMKMVFNGRPIREISASLGVGENLIYKWKSRSMGCQATAPHSGNQSVPISVSIADYDLIKARLREVEQERDILKKALGIFSRGN